MELRSASSAEPVHPRHTALRRTLIDTTTEQSSAGVSAPADAVGASEDAAARQRLIQQEELLLRESGTTDPLEAAASVDRSGTSERRARSLVE